LTRGGHAIVSPDDIRELFSVFGPVEVRRLFGGSGIYAGGTMFALVHEGVIYLKTDEQNAQAFEREKLLPFTYTRKGERASLLSYRRMPDRLYDDPDDLATWARAALAAAGRGRKRTGSPARQRRRAASSNGRGRRR
jgi:DNA transformation protein